MNPARKAHRTLLVLRRCTLTVLLLVAGFDAGSARADSKVADTTPLVQKVDLNEGLVAGLAGHWADSVDRVAWSPDGTRIATATWGPVVTIRDAATGEATAVLYGHRREITGLFWSPDGAYLATAADDEFARLWDAETGALIAELEGGRPQTPRLAWAPDSGFIAATVTGGIGIWSAAGKLTTGIRVSYSTADALAWSGDGKRLALASTDYMADPPSNDIRVFEMEVGKKPLVLEGHQDDVTMLAFSAWGSRLASGSKDDTARIWDLETGKPVVTVEDFEGDAAKGIGWAPDGWQIALAVDGASVRVLNALDGQDVAELPCGNPREGCLNVVWSPDGEVLAAADGHGSLQVWETGEFKRLYETVLKDDWFEDIAWSPDSGRLATGTSDETVRVWDRDSGEFTMTVSGGVKPVTLVVWAPDGRHAAIAMEDGRIVIWNEQSGKPVHVLLRGHHAEMSVLSWSPDGSLLASGDDHVANFVWDPVSGKQIAKLEGHTNDILSISWSPDGERIATGSYDETARVWDARTGKQIALLEGHVENVHAVAWAPDGKRVATGSDDSIVRIFDAATGKEIARHEEHEDDVENVAWSPDGTLLASAASDYTVRIWDLSNRSVAKIICCRVDLTAQLAWSPDGKRLATTANAQVVIWDRVTSDILTTETNFSHYPQYLVWSPDGKFIAAGSEFAPARVHGTRHGWWIREFNRDLRIFNWLDWNRDGSAILTGNQLGLVESWDLFEGRRKVFQMDLESGWVACDWPEQSCLRADAGKLLQTVGEEGLERIALPAADRE